jgi:acyl-CoA synthetase (AMP-forming)/AMP-acid ligase II
MIFRSPLPDVTIPDMPLAQFIFQRAEARADRPALIEGATGRALTYGQLARAIERAAAGLASRGFKKGDVFAIYAPNCPEYAIAFYAVARLGGINTTVNPLYTVEELTFQLNDSGTKYLLTTPHFIDKAREAVARSGVKEVFVLGEAEDAVPFARLLEADGPAPAVAINPREDLVALPYSSGTTGLPKGVMLTHYNLVSNLRQAEGCEPLPEDDVLVAVLPFFHIYGMVMILSQGLYRGATLVTMPRFDLEEFLRVLQDYAVTRAYTVPPIVLALAKHPLVDKYDLSPLRAIACGAAPLGPEVAAACAERLGKVVRQGYGMTEASPLTHFTPLNLEKINRGTSGQPVPNTECKIVDVGTGEELGPDQEGEIWVRGPQVMRGYLNRPEETAATVDGQGWLHTGDVGFADEDGFFYIVDRVKELIKYKGLQVAPAELEAVLLTHPAVADAAVVPSPDEEAGEVPKAFVVLKSPAAAEELMAFVAARVAPHKKIRLLEFAEQIPKTASGKILRRVLIERERKAAG